MISIGLDASTTCIGYGIFEDDKLIDYGALRSNKIEWRGRIMDESILLSNLLSKYKIDNLFVEDVPLKPGNKTLEKLGAVHGMILCLCAGYKISPTFILPSVWRKDIGLFDGTLNGMRREVLKERAILTANNIFHLELEWHGVSSKKSQDDIAEGVLIAYSQILKAKNHNL